MKKSFQYTLTDPIEVAIQGQHTTCADVEVFAPRARDGNNALQLECYLKRALMDMASRATSMINNESSQGDTKAIPEEPEELSPESQYDSVRMQIMSGADPTSITSMINLLRELFVGGNQENPQATIGGGKFTKPVFDDLYYKDRRELLVRYAAHFLS